MKNFWNRVRLRIAKAVLPRIDRRPAGGNRITFGEYAAGIEGPCERCVGRAVSEGVTAEAAPARYSGIDTWLDDPKL